MIQNIFDDQSSARAMNIPEMVIENEVREDYPDDAMLAELHILRALKSYAMEIIS